MLVALLQERDDQGDKPTDPPVMQPTILEQ
jgi:hypothetical protein